MNDKKTLKDIKKDKRNKKKNTFWIMILIGSLILMILLIISAILNIGEKLGNINKYLEYGFYLLSVILGIILILNPLRIILFAPTYSIVTTLDKPTRKNNKIYKKFAKNLVRYNDISEKDLLILEEGFNNPSVLKKNLNIVLDSSIKKEINKMILKNAKTVFISTAISQNGKLDMLTVLSINLKMIKDIVSRVGFRPSYPKLGKLSLNVLTTALVTENLEGLDFTDIFPTSTANYIGEIPLIKPIANSVINGLANSLLTLRVGIVTRRFLFSDVLVSKEEIRKKSIKESVKMLPLLISDVITFFPQRIAKLFSKNKNNQEESV